MVAQKYYFLTYNKQRVKQSRVVTAALWPPGTQAFLFLSIPPSVTLRIPDAARAPAIMDSFQATNGKCGKRGRNTFSSWLKSFQGTVLGCIQHNHLYMVIPNSLVVTPSCKKRFLKNVFFSHLHCTFSTPPTQQ